MVLFPFYAAGIFFTAEVSLPATPPEKTIVFPAEFVPDEAKQAFFSRKIKETVHPVSEEYPLAEVNEMGRIPILEYHNIGPEEHRWTRSAENFKGDLEWLYNNGYYLLSIEDYAKNYFPVAYGKKPVVLTFDDGKKNHFNYREDGSIDPDCAIGILDDFYRKHPDFGYAAVFYVNNDPFGQRELVGKKIEYLYKTGRQIGFHTLYHADFRSMSAITAASLLKAQLNALKPFLPDGMGISTLAYPHGWTPAGDDTPLSAIIKTGLLIGADPAYPLYHQKCDAFRVPRIQAIDEEWLRHFGREPEETGKAEKKEKFEVFVSDGVY